MLAKLARVILAFTTFPLLGGYGLRWVGGFVRDVIATTGVHPPVVAVLDYVGAIVGLLLGVILAIELIGCCVQSESLPVRPLGDNILIVLGLTLLTDVALGRVFAGAEWLRWLPPVNLVIWSGAAAATASVHRMRQQWGAQQAVPPAPQEDPYEGPYR